MYFAATFVASLIVSATALATPHVHDMPRRHQHAALAKARAPAPEPEPVAEPVLASAGLPKKRLNKRCKAHKSSTAHPSPTATTSSAKASASHAPVNVAPLPLPISIGTTPSDDPAPSPSHSPFPAPSPSPSAPEAPKPSPSQDPAPSSGGVTGGQSSSMFSGVQVGDGTFYGTGLGACGITNNDSQYIAAVSMQLFDKYPGYNGGNPNQNPVCGKKVMATYQGKSVTVTITDRCVACAPGDLDFSPAAFNTIADAAVGRIHGMKWKWL